MISQKLSSYFNYNSFKTKGLTLLIEHAPCCILSFAAGFIGISALNHNPVLELGFAMGGAIIGEYVGHKFFVKSHTHKGTGLKSFTKRYSVALAFGLASWGVHQALFHEHQDPIEREWQFHHHDHDHKHDHPHFHPYSPVS